MNLSTHFTLEELTHSDTAIRKGFANQPDAKQLDNLQKLCEDILEPTRALLGVPLHITSGFRDQQTNYYVGGVRNSQHLLGQAADFKPVGLDLKQAFDTIRASDILFDQLIFEHGTWIHISYSPTPKREVLIATMENGQTRYRSVK